MSKKSKWIAFSAYHETCPFVDAALSDLFETIKQVANLNDDQINELRRIKNETRSR